MSNLAGEIGLYVVKVIGGGEPTVTHSTYGTAANRAEQLARQTRKQVIVFRAYELYTPHPQNEERMPVSMERLQ